MKKVLSVLFKGVKLFTYGLVLGMMVYLLSAWLMPKVTVCDDSYPNSQANNTIFIMTNGVHTDLVLPINSCKVKWDTLIPFSNTISKDTNFKWVGFGWGDKGFYLNTPTWDDLTFGTAFFAATGLSTTAMHTTYYRFVKEDKECIKIFVTDDQLSTICQYIYQSFDKTKEGKFRWIETNAVYGKTDAFYEAIGNYSLFTTCNTWTNNGLKSAKLPACAWTPLDKGLMDLYSSLKIRTNN